MIKANDYVDIEVFGQKFVAKIVFVGNLDKNIRKISVLLIHPKLSKEIFSLVVDVESDVRVLSKEEIRVIRCLYE